MSISRPLLLTGLLFATMTVAPATGGVRIASILQEVQGHLDEAQKCVDDGSMALAIAHTQMVLVDDDVTVGVRFEGVSPSLRGKAVKTLDAAFRTWEAALGNTIHFHEVEEPAKADLIVRFRPDVRMGEEQVAGYSNWKRVIKSDHGRLLESHFSADLQIRTNLPDMTVMPTPAMKHEIMHEVGHILGLEDSDRQGDLMGPLDVNRPVSEPRSNESQAVANLRAEAKRIQKQAMASQIQG